MEEWKADAKDVAATEKSGYISYDLENGDVVVELTNEQLQFSLEWTESEIKEHQKNFATNGKNRFECSPDYKTISYYIDGTIDKPTFSLSLQTMSKRSATYRVFSGFEDDFEPFFQIYNYDTGKLITESDQNGTLEWTEEDWDNSAK